MHQPWKPWTMQHPPWTSAKCHRRKSEGGPGRVVFLVSRLLGKAIAESLRPHLMASAVEERGARGTMSRRSSSWRVLWSGQSGQMAAGGPCHNSVSTLDRDPWYRGRRHLQLLTRGSAAAGEVAGDPTFLSRKNSWAQQP